MITDKEVICMYLKRGNKMITDKEVIRAFDILHEYCDERECENCIFWDDKCEHGDKCALKKQNPALLSVEETTTISYKIRG